MKPFEFSIAGKDASQNFDKCKEKEKSYHDFGK